MGTLSDSIVTKEVIIDYVKTIFDTKYTTKYPQFSDLIIIGKNEIEGRDQDLYFENKTEYDKWMEE